MVSNSNLIEAVPETKNAPTSGAFIVLDRRTETDTELRFRDVGGLRPFLPLDNLELDAIAFGERLEAAALDGAEVDEDIRPSLAGDEAVALGVIEPLHGTLESCHEPYLFFELCSHSSPSRLSRPLRLGPLPRPPEPARRRSQMRPGPSFCKHLADYW